LRKKGLSGALGKKWGETSATTREAIAIFKKNDELKCRTTTNKRGKAGGGGL